MFEVEKKFILSEQDKKRVTKSARLLNELVFTDTYYDTANYSLSSCDKWLRLRDKKFELKLPLNQDPTKLVDQYNELEDEESIRKELGFTDHSSLSNNLDKNGYKPFATFTTTRKKYQNGSFNIDLDSIDFGSSTYTLGEIELMVADKSEVKNAIEKIMDFARENKLVITPVRGKVIEYIKRTNPTHYKLLVKKGVVKDF